jgi:hypothetical protein
MAEICSCTPQAIHRWYDGNTKSPSADNIAAIAKHYKLDHAIGWVITGEGECTMKLDTEDIPIQHKQTIARLAGITPKSVTIEKLTITF